MDAARWERIQALFHAALDLPESERAAFLDAACADPGLVQEVRALLDEDAADGSILDLGLAVAAREVLDGSVPPLRRVGPFHIRGVLGQGGMGVVYLAERDDLGSKAAIKVLRDASLSPLRRERFAREQQTLAQLSHPCIARLFDADVLPDGTPYFVMEYVEGVPLTEYCRTHACSVAERLKLFRTVCSAVQYAHGQAVVHRDLKPSNILVARATDGQPAVKLLDFGIAKQLEDVETSAQQTQTGFRLMTPAYAAPEQLQGRPVGVYTDVYALGVLLYELLTGTLPFETAGLTPGQIERRILEQEPEKPSVRAARAAGAAWTAALSRSAWADLDVLCLKAMHRDPRRRYPTVEALVRDLDHFARGEPLEARPDTLRYRAGKFLRRHDRAVAAAALVVALVVGLVAFYTVRLTEQRNLAQAEAEKARQVSAYLIDLFEAGDPYAPDADSLDVRTLLLRGTKRADALSGQPLAQAQVLSVLGRVYLQLSQYEHAEPLLRRSLALRRSRLGDFHLDVAESLTNMGVYYAQIGAFDSAEVAFRDALAIRRQLLPPNHPDLASSLDDLGVVLSRLGDHRAAETYYLLALQIRRAIYDRPHEDLGYSLNNLAVHYYNQGDFAAAERFYREALDVDRAYFGPDHPNVATDLANLGKLLEDQGAFAAAESLLTEALRIRRATLGDEHYETALSLSQLGGMLRRKKDFDGAEAYLREAMEIRSRLLGPDHPSTATTLSHLALTLQDRGDYAAADSLLHRTLGVYTQSLGEDHWFTGIILCHLGELASLRGRPGLAESRFRQGLAVLAAALPADHHQIAYNESRLGALLAGQARYAEAESLLVRGYEGLLAHGGNDHEHTRDAAQRLVRFYDAWGRPEAAEHYRHLTAVVSMP